MPKLSILICTLLSRAALLNRLMSVLTPQLTKEIEVLVEADSGERTIGAKRNALLSRATGQYVCFIDDDDLVAGNYVQLVMEGIERNVDVVAIQGIFTTDGKDPQPFIDCPYGGHRLARVNGKVEFHRGVQHLDAIKRGIAQQFLFPDISFTEDYEWGTAIERSKIVKTWHRIDRPIYFYDYWSNKDRPMPKLAVVMPVYNHVFTTFRSIETLLENTSDPNFCLILVDDGSSDETPDLVQWLSKKLGMARMNYHRNPANLGVNASWNKGIEIALARDCPYIAVVNNDVLFSPKWDAPLVRSLEQAGVGLVSPLSTRGGIPPDWPRGNERNVNPAGYPGYMPLLGACFVGTADTFRKIGPIPPSLKTYFGDNWLALKAQSLGLQCGYDNDSYVHHLFCITSSKIPAEEQTALWANDGPAFDKLEQEIGFHMHPFAPPPPGVPEIRPNEAA